MAKKKYTQEDAVKFINNVNTDFLNAYVPYFTNVEIVNNFEGKKAELQENINEIEAQMEDFFKNKNLKMMYEFVYSKGNGLDAEHIYSEYFCVGNEKCFLDDVPYDGTNWKKEHKVNRLVSFFEDYKNKENEFNAIERKDEILEYIKLSKELDKLEGEKKGKGFFKKLEINKKEKGLNKDIERLGDLSKNAEKFLNLKKELEIKNKAYEKLVLILPQILPDFQVMNQKLKNLNNELSLYQRHLNNIDIFSNTEVDLYEQMTTANEIVKKLQDDAKEFKLIKYFRENEKNFQESGLSLAVIYAGNISDKKFFTNFQKNLKKYEKAKEIAKEKGKNFKEISDTEKFEYFELAEEKIKDKNCDKENN